MGDEGCMCEENDLISSPFLSLYISPSDAFYIKIDCIVVMNSWQSWFRSVGHPELRTSVSINVKRAAEYVLNQLCCDKFSQEDHHRKSCGFPYVALEKNVVHRVYHNRTIQLKILIWRPTRRFDWIFYYDTSVVVLTWNFILTPSFWLEISTKSFNLASRSTLWFKV